MPNNDLRRGRLTPPVKAGPRWREEEMTKSDEYIPEQELREAILSNEVLLRIKALSKEAKCCTSYRTVIRVQGVDVENQENEGFWRIRLTVRHAFNPKRKLWRVQAIISQKDETGFSGIQMAGDARLIGDRWIAKSTGYTVLYNSQGIER